MTSNEHHKDQSAWSRHRTNVFKRKDAHPDTVDHEVNKQPRDIQPDPEKANGEPTNHKGYKVTRGIQPDGESGRSWINPMKMASICWRSSCEASKWTNLLWPFTIAALVLYFNYPQHELWIFICSYIGMVPAANLVGFAGQELARKIPKVAGVLLEVTFGSVVEIILFMVLISGPESNTQVIKAAILGSILANMLLCLGMFDAACCAYV